MKYTTDIKLRIAVFSEALNPPFDEGIKRTALEIVRSLTKTANVKGISQACCCEENVEIICIPSNRLLVSSTLRSFFHSFQPEVVIYVPGSCGTIWSFLRGRVLQFLSGGRPVVMILLQPRIYTPLKRFIIHHLHPQLALAPSRAIISNLSEVGVDASFIPLGVDIYRFKPLANPQYKLTLRRKYGIPVEKKIVLHVGHINTGRNLESLIALQNESMQVVVVGSTSTPTREGVDGSLKQRLENRGVMVLKRVLEQPQEVFQLSDIYVFPVLSPTGSIGIPLSVLEAAACGIPVVSTDPQGGLADLIKYTPAFGTYIAKVNGDSELIEQTKVLLSSHNTFPLMPEDVRQRLSWDHTSEVLMEAILYALSSKK